MLSIMVPFPPSANRLWRSVNGRNIKSAEYRTWENIAVAEAYYSSGDKKRIPGSYRLLVEAQRPDRRRRDLGNLEKPLSDILVTLNMVDDDCLAEEITLRWVKEDLGGMVRMTVTSA